MNVNASRGSTGYRGSVDFRGDEFICLVEQGDVKEKKGSAAPVRMHLNNRHGLQWKQRAKTHGRKDLLHKKRVKRSATLSGLKNGIKDLFGLFFIETNLNGQEFHELLVRVALFNPLKEHLDYAVEHLLHEFPLKSQG